jgi:hypothetical protein
VKSAWWRPLTSFHFSGKLQGMRSVFLCLCAILVFFAACSSTDPKKNQPMSHVVPTEAEIQQIIQERKFDPSSITKEEKEVVRVDVNNFVSMLNALIKRKDYNAWVKLLTPQYQQYLSSKENLEIASNADRLKRGRIVLKSLYDYFINVVVPSRNNIRADDIDFVDENTVKVYMVNGGQRLRAYELVRDGTSWKVSN